MASDKKWWACQSCGDDLHRIALEGGGSCVCGRCNVTTVGVGGVLVSEGVKRAVVGETRPVVGIDASRVVMCAECKMLLALDGKLITFRDRCLCGDYVLDKRRQDASEWSWVRRDVVPVWKLRLIEKCLGGGVPTGATVKEEEPKPETVDHPSHYGGADNVYEAIKVIEAWSLGFHLGNAVKYISRAGRKGDALTDLRKAAWYLNREIENREKGR